MMITEIIEHDKSVSNISSKLLTQLADKLADKLTANYFSFAVDFKKKQIELNQEENLKAEAQKRIERINAANNISIEDFSRFVIKNLNQMVEERNPNKRFLLDDNCKNAYNLLLGYFHGSSGTMNRQKPIAFLGPIGTGKSTLIAGFKDNPFSSFRIIKAQELVDAFINNPDACIAKLLSHKPLTDKENAFGHVQYDILIEEVGREQLSVNVKGESFKNTPINVVERILMELYDYPQIRVHFVSNAETPEKLEALYGEAAASRIYDMFNVIRFDPLAPNRRFI